MDILLSRAYPVGVHSYSPQTHCSSLPALPIYSEILPKACRALLNPNTAVWHPVNSLLSSHLGRRLMKDTELKTFKRSAVSECCRYIDTTCSLALSWELLNHVVMDFGTKGQTESCQLASLLQIYSCHSNQSILRTSKKIQQVLLVLK